MHIVNTGRLRHQDGIVIAGRIKHHTMKPWLMYFHPLAGYFY